MCCVGLEIQNSFCSTTPPTPITTLTKIIIIRSDVVNQNWELQYQGLHMSVRSSDTHVTECTVLLNMTK